MNGKEAIKMLRTIKGTVYLGNRKFYEAIDVAIKTLEQPTIEPQRKKGHWIRHPEQRNIFNGKTIECSECHEKYTVQYVEDELFCRHCGADMREDAEEPKKCDTCKHEKERWFSRCADCTDYELWENKE